MRHGAMLLPLAILTLGGESLGQESKELATFRVSTSGTDSVALSPDGKTLAVLNRKGFFHDVDAELRILDVATGNQRVAPLAPGNSFASLTFATDGRLFLIGNPDSNTIKLWEVSLRKRDKK